jgi:hypothetical protein
LGKIKQILGGKMKQKNMLRKFYFDNQNILITCCTDKEGEFKLECPIFGYGEIYYENNIDSLSCSSIIEINGKAVEGKIYLNDTKITIKRCDDVMSKDLKTIKILAYDWGTSKKPVYEIVIRTDLKEDEFKGLYNAIRTELKITRCEYDKRHFVIESYEPQVIFRIMKERNYIEVLEDELSVWQVGK